MGWGSPVVTINGSTTTRMATVAFTPIAKSQRARRRSSHSGRRRPLTLLVGSPEGRLTPSRRQRPPPTQPTARPFVPAGPITINPARYRSRLPTADCPSAGPVPARPPPGTSHCPTKRLREPPGVRTRSVASLVHKPGVADGRPRSDSRRRTTSPGSPSEPIGTLRNRACSLCGRPRVRLWVPFRTCGTGRP